MFNNAFTNISFIDKSIQPLVNQIQFCDKFGICNKGAYISEIKINHDEILTDQFTLTIPYGNKYFKCNIMFDLNYPHLGPDFIFEDDSFLFDPTAEEVMRHLPSLANWNVNDHNALLNVLKELLNYYKEHQLQICEMNGISLKFDYEMLVPDIVKPEDMEIIVTQEKNKMEARFYINLNMDYSSLPYRKIQTFKDIATLVITFQGSDWKRITPYLELTENLKSILQSYNNIKLPATEAAECVMDYVTNVKLILHKRIQIISSLFNFKLEFITLLKKYQPHNVIEYDSEEFRYITMMFQHKKYFILKFSLPPMFPEDKPEMSLHSVYAIHKVYNVKNFEYNATWSPKEMIANLYHHIVHKEIDKFIKLSEEKGY